MNYFTKLNSSKKLYKILSVLSVSLIITFLVTNYLGPTIEGFWKIKYQKISGKKPQYYEYDSSGIPLVVYEDGIGAQYSTVTVAEYAIRIADERDSVNNGIFNNCISWLMKNNIILNDSSILFCDHFDWPSYEMTDPWRSAMNQGRAMQAFMKAYERTRDTTFIGYTDKSMNTLFTEVKDGGVTYIDSLGYWYEEYADDNAPQSRVLNGMIVVLQALSEYNKLTGDLKSKFLFIKGEEAVRNTIHRYDNKGNSNYDALGKPASIWYHKFHIGQLDFLYQETHESIYNEYKQKWLQYKEPSYLATLIEKPTRIRIFSVFSLFLGVSLVVMLGYYFASIIIKKLYE